MMKKSKEAVIQGIKNGNLKKKLGERCVYCKCNNKLVLTIDHKTPLIRGGEDTDENKHIACFVCNQVKGPLTHEEFLEYNKALIILKELNKLKVYIIKPKVTFCADAYPKKLEDLENKEEIPQE